ncbi:hypothetical protein PVK06_004096 [Gossypium arboreum]|uniref:Uncharacterized protein n=1 Tax=Gossypium arboreum TaxID=29729 RepID=A0ABR0QS35_GOSAR|nr:hypothetical protein PVK06_004096 [Gossypium arboreum]
MSTSCYNASHSSLVYGFVISEDTHMAINDVCGCLLGAIPSPDWIQSWDNWNLLVVNGFDSQGNFKASVEYMNQFTENGKPFLLNEAVIPFRSGHGHLRRVVRPSSASQPQQSTNALNVDDYSMSFAQP